MSNKNRWYRRAGLLALAGLSALNGCGQVARFANPTVVGSHSVSISSAAGAAAGNVDMARVTHAAGGARSQCQDFMHEDADEFVSCIDAVVARRVAGESERASAERELGITYFAWVGANNSARIGLPGAAQATDKYRRLFQSLQRRLGMTDRALCAVVAGDCELRTAQLQAQALP